MYNKLTLLGVLLISNCLVFKENNLDPNSGLSQILGLNLIRNALEQREIRIIGKGLNTSRGNEPYWGLIVQVRKMSNQYFTNYSSGLSETSEGEFIGTFLSDLNGDIELPMESGLGIYRFDFYDGQMDGFPEYIHSQILSIQSYRQSLSNILLSQFPSSRLNMNWRRIDVAFRSPYQNYNISMDGSVGFVGERNGRAFYSGRLFTPRDMEFSTQPTSRIINFKLRTFLAYTDDGLTWDSIVFHEIPLEFSNLNLSFLGFLMTDTNVIAFF